MSRADAQRLEDLWLDLPTFNDDGPQLNPLPWREDEYAYYVGRLVTEGARCDAALNGVATRAYSALEYPTKKIDELHGESGKKLASALIEIGERCLSEALTDLGRRYGAWYEERNLAVHGVRPLGPDGHPTSKVYKLNRIKSQPSVRTTIRDQDFRQLIEIWRAFYALNHDAFEASLHLGFYNRTTDVETAEQYIARIPLSSTVAPEERMPSR